MESRSIYERSRMYISGARSPMDIRNDRYRMDVFPIRTSGSDVASDAGGDDPGADLSGSPMAIGSSDADAQTDPQIFAEETPSDPGPPAKRKAPKVKPAAPGKRKAAKKPSIPAGKGKTAK